MQQIQNASKVKLSLSLIHTFDLNPTDCMQTIKRCKKCHQRWRQHHNALKSKRWEERWSGFENFLLFWFSGISLKFSRNFEFSRILENSREISLLDLDLEVFSFHFSLLEKSESDFYFTFHFSKRVNQISISLFTSRKE